MPAYCLEEQTQTVLKWLQNALQPVTFTPIHRLELRTALRLRVFRNEITVAQRALAFAELDSDLEDGVLRHVTIPWTDALKHAERLGMLHVETAGIRSVDLLHLGIAICLESTHFLTFDGRQRMVAEAAGLRVRF